MSTDELVMLISQAGREAVERDTLYNVVKKYSAKNKEEFNVALN
jgi:2-iminoacetate synthase ThiH